MLMQAAAPQPAIGTTSYQVIEGQRQLPPSQPAQLTDGVPGYRQSGLPTTLDPIEQMLGKALSASENDALLYTLLNQFIKSTQSSPEQMQMMTAALLFTLKEQAGVPAQ